MKTVRYFHRSYAVPADAAPGVRANGLKESVEALAVYRLYGRGRTRSVVYSGTTSSVPTGAMPMAIIAAIARREKIKPHQATWFDLQTVMQDSRLASGEYKYLLVLLKKGRRLQGEYVVEVPCPAVVLRDFAEQIAGRRPPATKTSRPSLSLVRTKTGSTS